MALRELTAAVVVALPFGIGAATTTAEPPPIFRFTDPEIVESSGLAVRDGLVVTVNDSGDGARVFAVDPATGATVGVTRWPGQPLDIEALAPAGPGEVWVGDIGDNGRVRDSIRVTRVPVGHGDRLAEPVTHELRYPDGGSDAEALLAHPVTGRLYVATKGVLGGRLYAAPTGPGGAGPHRLRPLGAVMPLVTDGAFFPDGRHLVLRDYTRAIVLSFPALEPVGELSLPDTRQGEGIAVAPDGRVLVSSEGLRAPVHEVRLPADVVRAVQRTRNGEPSPAAEPRESSSPSATPSSRAQPEDPTGAPPARAPWPWLLAGVAGLAVVAVLLRSLRPR